MPNEVLYFPYIRVPQNEWFIRVLLYWDQVGSIVPYEYIFAPERLGSFMRELVTAGLVKQVQPGAYIHDIPNFNGAFLDLIDKNEIIQQARERPHEEFSTVRIHLEKLHPVAKELGRRRLARESPQYPWFEVEQLTANLFMAYLASVLGRVRDLQMTPITDQTEMLSVFSSSPQESLSSAALTDRLRMCLLEGILPAPTGGIPVKELATFKDQHRDLLSRFRRHIEAFLIDVSLIADPARKQERIDYFRKDSQDQISEIRSRMVERRWPRIVFGTFSGLVAAAIPGAAGIATGSVESALSALPGLVTAVYSAFAGATQQKDILRAPLAYAALAQEKFQDLRHPN